MFVVELPRQSANADLFSLRHRLWVNGRKRVCLLCRCVKLKVQRLLNEYLSFYRPKAIVFLIIAKGQNRLRHMAGFVNRNRFMIVPSIKTFSYLSRIRNTTMRIARTYIYSVFNFFDQTKSWALFFGETFWCFQDSAFWLQTPLTLLWLLINVGTRTNFYWPIFKKNQIKHNL